MAFNLASLLVRRRAVLSQILITRYIPPIAGDLSHRGIRITSVKGKTEPIGVFMCSSTYRRRYFPT